MEYSEFPGSKPKGSSRNQDKIHDFLSRLFAESTRKSIEPAKNEYEYFPSIGERSELVYIANSLTEYLHSQKVRSLILVDRSARPAYIGVKKLWRKKYPDEKPPDIYFINPTGFVSLNSANMTGDSGILTKGEELVLDGIRKGNPLGDPTYEARNQYEIEQDIKESYRRLFEHKDDPALLFDTCIHTGDSIKPVINTLKDLQFQDLKIGVVSDTRNDSGIQPDLTILNRDPFNYCYPFHKDRIIERSFDSVSSKPNPSLMQRENSIALRKEVSRIFDQAPPTWYGLKK